MHPESSGCHIYILYLYYIVHFSRQNFPLFHKRRTGKRAFCGFHRFCAAFAPTFHRLSTEKATEAPKNRLLFFTAFPPISPQPSTRRWKTKRLFTFSDFSHRFSPTGKRQAGKAGSGFADFSTVFTASTTTTEKRKRFISLFLLEFDLLHFPQRG